MSLRKLEIETTGNGAIEITSWLREIVAASGVAEGVCVVHVPHTTAGLSITSYADPLGHEDIHDDINRLIPTRIDFKHQHDTPQDAAGHIKSVLVGVNLTLIIATSTLLLGSSQGVFFNEFDGPRSRNVLAKCMSG
jgi:secondary thiamine-phosphate synthase enzyme